MKQKTNLIKFIQLWGLILIIGIGGLVLSFDILLSYHEFHIQTKQMRAKYIARQKHMIKHEVKRVIDLINYKKAQAEILTKKEIKSRVYEAYSISRSIYLHNKVNKTESEIKHMIINALRPIRFARNTGYYFINGFDGKPLLFPSNPGLEGVDLSNVRDTHGQYITEDMIKIVKKSGEGFYEYHWTKFGEKGNFFKKIAFVKLFEPYNLLIGTGLYVEDIENHIKTDLLNDISRIRFGKEGYIFVNHLNGDALISNGQVVSGTKKLWEIFNKYPEKTKSIFKKEYKAALSPDGDYIYYSLIKLTNSEVESPKASFICQVPYFKWIVGAGVYLDDVEKDIAIMRVKLNREVKTRLFYFLLITAVIVVCFLFLLEILTRRLENDFNIFISFFEKASISDEPMNRDLIKFDELDSMAEYANNMLDEKIKSEQDILNERERLFVTIHSIGDGVIACDTSGKIDLMNQVAEQLTGWKFKDAENRYIMDIFNIINSDTGEKVKNPVDKVLSSGKITGLANHTLLVSHDGTEYQIADSAAPIKDNNGKIKGVVLVFRDVTGEYRMQAELQKMDKLRSVGILAGGIAHDFNNIMTGLYGNLSIVKAKLSRDHSEFKFLEKAENSMDRAIRLTKQLLTFAKGGKPVLEKTALSPLIEEMVNFDLSGSDVRLVFDAADDLWMAEIDKGQIQQVLSNITINAVQAMPDGGNLYISLNNMEIAESMIADLAPGKYIKIMVKDEGCGIDEPNLHRIFDPYFTTRGMGNGLGLAVAYSIIKQHGGHIKAMSEPAKGAVFILYLPAFQERHNAEESENAEDTECVDDLSVEEHTAAEKSVRILIMDDDEAIRMVVAEMLEAIGFLSESAVNGEQTVEMYRMAMDRGEPFDLIIMDLTIKGGMGGKKAVHEILMIDPDASVIISSGYAGDPVMANYAEYGFKGIITKPYTIGNLKTVLEQILERP